MLGFYWRLVLHFGPTVDFERTSGKIWRGLVRDKRRATDSPAPLLVEGLKAIIETLPRYEEAFEKNRFEAAVGALTLTARRDRAILLVGWAGAMRRSEIVGLSSEGVTLRLGKGLGLALRQSKTD